VRTGQLVKKWPGHEHSVSSVTFTPDGIGLLSGGYDRAVKYWDVGSLRTVQSSRGTVEQRYWNTKVIQYV
jgi:WD40 repeat protein